MKRNFKGFRSPKPLLNFSFFPPKTKPAREIFLDMTSLFCCRRPIRRRCLSSLIMKCGSYHIWYLIAVSVQIPLMTVLMRFLMKFKERYRSDEETVSV